MTPQEIRSMRREQVVRCLSTTMTIKDWCALNGVPQSTMYGWMSRFRKEEPELFESPSSGEWIELSREAVSARTALATRPDAIPAHHAPTSASASPAGSPRDASAIVVSMNGAAVAVPPGSAEADIATVLRAVASL